MLVSTGGWAGANITRRNQALTSFLVSTCVDVLQLPSLKRKSRSASEHITVIYCSATDVLLTGY